MRRASLIALLCLMGSIAHARCDLRIFNTSGHAVAFYTANLFGHDGLFIGKQDPVYQGNAFSWISTTQCISNTHLIARETYGNQTVEYESSLRFSTQANQVLVLVYNRQHQFCYQHQCG